MRDLDTDFAAAFAAPRVQPALLGQFFFDSGTIGMWTGVGELVFDGTTYVGGGSLIGVSAVQEAQGTQANSVTVSLNGVSPDLIALALEERCRGRAFRIYLASVQSQSRIELESAHGAVLTQDGTGYVVLENTITTPPQRIFSGLMDTMEITDDGHAANIALTVESILIVGQRAKIRRYTAQDQNQVYPNDVGLNFINQLQNAELVW